MENFFNQIGEDLSQQPPKFELIIKVLNDLVDGLCKFVPRKPSIHTQIRSSIIFKEEDMYDNNILL